MTAGRRRAAGFTLLEILVALVVLGFLMAGLSQGVRFGLHAWDGETRLVNQRADLDAVERVLRDVVTEADPGGATDPNPLRGEAHSMAFTTRLPMAAGGPLLRDADIGLGVDARRRLVLRWTPHPHAERLVAAAPPAETALLEGVDHIELSYLGLSTQRGGGWVSSWSAPALPQMIRIRLVFPKGDPRHWPDMVAAPMRARA
jgi:general secretion pathway protein J